MIYLKQSTASQEVPLGYFLDSTDGNTEETGLTIANTDIKIWKTGATSLASKNSGGATHISNGVYYAVLDATDTDTVGPLVIFAHVAGALAVRLECCVLSSNIYDWMFGTTAPAATSDIPSAAAIATEVWGTNLSTDGTASEIIITGLDAPVSSRLADGDYSAPDNASITAIKAKTDSLTFTVAGQVDSNIQSVNDITVTGTGVEGDEWGP